MPCFPAAESTRLSAELSHEPMIIHDTHEVQSVDQWTEEGPGIQDGEGNHDEEATGDLNISESFERPAYPEEDIMEEQPLPDTLITDEGPRFQILDGATQRKKPMLLDNRGYSFTIKGKKGRVTKRWCTVRNKRERCPAAVSEMSGVFREGHLRHCHPVKPGLLTARKVKVQAKYCGMTDLFKSAGRIVQNAMLAHIDIEAPCPALQDTSLYTTVYSTRFLEKQ